MGWGESINKRLKESGVGESINKRLIESREREACLNALEIHRCGLGSGCTIFTDK